MQLSTIRRVKPQRAIGKEKTSSAATSCSLLSWSAFAVLVLCSATALLGQTRSLAPCLPLRGPGVNEGFTDLAGVGLGWPTTMTVADITSPTKPNRGFAIVKIWPIYQSLGFNELDSIFNDPNVQTVVFRPYYNQTVEPPSAHQFAQQDTVCGVTGFQWADLDTDYGRVAQLLYQKYGSQNKTVILTGWEADNEINYWPKSHPGCAWPLAQADVDSFRALLQARQNGVAAARQQNASANLRVFHAVEVRRVPDVLSPRNPGKNVLERIIPKMNPGPDFISFSAWGTTPVKIPMSLNNIATASGLSLSHDRIYVGEWGCAVGSSNRTSCYSDHASAVLNWGARMWLAWTYSGDTWQLVDTSGGDTANGFSVLATIKNSWQQSFSCQ